MKAKHTSGPWDIHEDADHIEIHPLSDSNGTHIIADVVNIRISANERKANARLIAAAPELLEALQYLADSYQKTRPNDCELVGEYVEARCAIAKATGR